MVVANLGEVIEYDAPQELIAGNAAIGRDAVVEEQWVKFRGIVGTPDMNRDQMQLSKLNGSIVQIHTVTELELTRTVRRLGRRYGLVSRDRCLYMGQEMWRYIAQAEVERA